MSLGRGPGWRSIWESSKYRQFSNETRILKKRESTVSNAFLKDTAGQTYTCKVITNLKSWSALEMVGSRGRDSLIGEGLRENRSDQETTSIDNSIDEFFCMGAEK